MWYFLLKHCAVKFVEKTKHPAGAPSEPLRGKNSRGRGIQNPRCDKKTGLWGSLTGYAEHCKISIEQQSLLSDANC